MLPQAKPTQRISAKNLFEKPRINAGFKKIEHKIVSKTTIKIQTQSKITSNLKVFNQNLHSTKTVNQNKGIEQSLTKDFEQLNKISKLLQKKQQKTELKRQPQNQKQLQLNQKKDDNKVNASKITLCQTKSDIKPVPKSRAKQFKQQLIHTIPLEAKTSVHKWRYGDGSTSSKLILSSWNVNGIRSVLNKNVLIPYLYRNKIDIICIQQTKMDENAYDLNPISIHGYNGYWNFSKFTTGYSGVAVFSKYMARSMTEDFFQRQFSQEGRLMTLQFQKFLLVNVYAPTSGRQLERLKYRQKYDGVFRNHIAKLQKDHAQKFILVIGDLNVSHNQIDLYPAKNNHVSASFTPIERKGFNELLDLGFIDTFRYMNPTVVAYTWWYVLIGHRDKLDTTGLGRRLDYFLISSQAIKYVQRSIILREVTGADHCPIQLEINMEK